MKLLLLGGYGNFGKRLLKSLVENYPLDITIAGRSLRKAVLAQAEIKKQFGKNVEILQIDVVEDDLKALFSEHNFYIVVNACGPYQHQAYQVAEACLASGSHYIDLADDRNFVSGFLQKFDQQAKRENLMLIAGASTVPGLSTAVIKAFENRFSSIHKVYYGISPGNKTERGEATIRSILSYAGKKFLSLNNGEMEARVGWQDLVYYDFGAPLGKRWMSNCDIPDLDILPKQFPRIKSIHFQAGLEVHALHLGLWLFSFLSRAGLVSNWQDFTKQIMFFDKFFHSFGSDAGGMFVELEGCDPSGRKQKICWQLVAENGVGPNVPTIATELTVKNILENKIKVGARACIDQFSLEEFMKIASRWGIYQVIK